METKEKVIEILSLILSNKIKVNFNLSPILGVELTENNYLLLISYKNQNEKIRLLSPLFNDWINLPLSFSELKELDNKNVKSFVEKLEDVIEKETSHQLTFAEKIDKILESLKN